MKSALTAAAALGACLLMFFVDLGSAPLNTKGEPRVGLQVQEQLRSGDWILPRLNGRFMPSKPPLFPWLAGVTAIATGSVDERALRIPSALLATTVVLVILWLAMHRWSSTAGICAALILATNFEWLRAARVARVDMTHTAFLVGALVAFERATAGPAPRFVFVALFYVCMGLAALAKGPVGIVLPLLVGLAYLLVTRDLGRLRQLHLAAGLAATVAIAGAWYVLALMAGGGAFLDVVYQENVLRFVHRSARGGAHVHPFYYYGPEFLAGFLPWSPFLVPLALWLYRRRDSLQARGLLYPIIWFAAVLLFYSASAGKRAVYILSAYPAAALLLGVWWSDAIHAAAVLPPTLARGLRWVGVTAAALLALILLTVLASAVGASPLALLGPLLHARDQSNLPFVGQILRTHYAVLGLGVTALLVLTVLFIASVERRGWATVFLWVVVVTGGLATLVNSVFQPAVAEQRTLKTFLASVRELTGSDALAFYGRVDLGAAFYARRHIQPLSRLDEAGKDTPTYVLIWEEDWQHLKPQERARLQRLIESAPTEAKGQRRLLLARFLPSNS